MVNRDIEYCKRCDCYQLIDHSCFADDLDDSLDLIERQGETIKVMREALGSIATPINLSGSISKKDLFEVIDNDMQMARMALKKVDEILNNEEKGN